VAAKEPDTEDLEALEAKERVGTSASPSGRSGQITISSSVMEVPRTRPLLSRGGQARTRLTHLTRRHCGMRSFPPCMIIGCERTGTASLIRDVPGNRGTRSTGLGESTKTTPISFPCSRLLLGSYELLLQIPSTGLETYGTPICFRQVFQNMLRTFVTRKRPGLLTKNSFLQTARLTSVSRMPLKLSAPWPSMSFGWTSPCPNCYLPWKMKSARRLVPAV
jgi:hypothetical protein